MKKFILPTLLLAFACTQAQAQTKRIAHRSHSGADKNFSLSGSDNFGNPPEDWRTKKLETVPAIDTAKAGTKGVPANGDRKKTGNKKMTRKQKRQASRGPQ